MAARMLPAIMSLEKRIAMSDQGKVAVLKKPENCIEIYGKGETENPEQQWMHKRLYRGLVVPYDVCFAPNNHLVVSDIGDNAIKIFNLEGDAKQVSHMIIGQDPYRHLIHVHDINGMNMELSTRVLWGLSIRIPQNVVVGPPPLSQLFVTSGTDIVLINMNWNKMSPVSWSQICFPLDWRLVQYSKSLMCDNVSTVQDHKDNHKVGGFNPLVITKAQFCGMFYHVTEANHAGFMCLDRSECKIGKRGDKKKFAETVVIYVRVADENGRLIFHARYGNCYEGPNSNTAHAEYFMLVDEEFRQAVKFLRDRMGGNITMYMNKQPCSRSTSHGRKTALKVKDCTQELINFFNVYCSTGSIKLQIYLCQLYKVDMDVPHEISLAQDFINAQLGLKTLLSSGIEVIAMSQESWTKLAEFADIELPEYQESARQKLDKHIDNFLSKMKIIQTATLLYRFANSQNIF